MAQLVTETEAVKLECDEREHRRLNIGANNSLYNPSGLGKRQITARKAELKRRREMLALARQAHEENAQITSEGEEDVAEARQATSRYSL